MMLPIANHCMAVSFSPKNHSPATAPHAGFKLMSTPTVRVGSRGMANVSSEYGNALDSSATAMATGMIDTENNAIPAFAIPTGKITAAPTNMPNAVV